MTCRPRQNPFYAFLAGLVDMCLTITLAHGEPIPEGPEKEPQVTEFTKPWKDGNKAIILDAYEKNHIEWMKVVKNRQIKAFIGKASDGMPSPYACPGDAHTRILCKKTFQNYFMKQQLYNTRKTLAKNLGLKWGAYHLGRPGNPVYQANHFLEFAKPEDDELMAIDIEHDNPDKWISFEDAETFAKHIHHRTGRYPVLYTNHDTAKKIAARRDEFPILSRLHLWYARFRPEIEGVFPMGNWKTYSIWQFSAGVNCNKSRCLYRVDGTPHNIDVNVSSMTIDEFNKQWPFDQLVPELPPEEPEQVLVSNDQPELQRPVIQASVRIEEKPSNIPTRNPGKPLTKVELSELGVDEIAIPSPSPKAVEDGHDAVNLIVRVRSETADKDDNQSAGETLKVADNKR